LDPNSSEQPITGQYTLTSAAFGLDGPLEFIGSAQAQSYANAKLVDQDAQTAECRRQEFPSK
jgi:hypothetical protein